MNTSDNNKLYLMKQNDNSCTYAKGRALSKNQNSFCISIDNTQKGFKRNFCGNYNDRLPINKEFKCLFVTTPEKLLVLLVLVILSMFNRTLR